MRLSWTQIAPGMQCRESTFTSRCHEVLDRSTFSQEALFCHDGGATRPVRVAPSDLGALNVRSEAASPRQVDLLSCLLHSSPAVCQTCADRHRAMRTSAFGIRSSGHRRPLYMQRT